MDTSLQLILLRMRTPGTVISLQHLDSLRQQHGPPNNVTSTWTWIAVTKPLINYIQQLRTIYKYLQCYYCTCTQFISIYKITSCTIVFLTLVFCCHSISIMTLPAIVARTPCIHSYMYLSNSLTSDMHWFNLWAFAGWLFQGGTNFSGGVQLFQKN